MGKPPRTRAPGQQRKWGEDAAAPLQALDVHQMLFPTKVKAKISSKLSYPLGAELISSELADVPQAQSLEISFHAKYEQIETRGKPYPIFTVAYSGTQSYPVGWSIDVRPVPRALKHRIKETFSCELFPSIRKWLGSHAALNSRHGFHALDVVLDEASKALLRLEERHTPDVSKG